MKSIPCHLYVDHHQKILGSFHACLMQQSFAIHAQRTYVQNICSNYQKSYGFSYSIETLGEKTSYGLENYIGNYDNIILILFVILVHLGDMNLEFSEHFCNIYYLKNLVKEPTCYKSNENPCCNDLFLTNRPKTFQ